MKERIISVLCCVSLGFILAGCGGSEFAIEADNNNLFKGGTMTVAQIADRVYRNAKVNSEAVRMVLETNGDLIIVSEINNFAYYKASGGCARILQGNMPLSAAKIRRSKRQNEKSFVVYYKWIGSLPVFHETEEQIFVHAGVDEEAEEYWKWGTGDE